MSIWKYLLSISVAHISPSYPHWPLCRLSAWSTLLASRVISIPQLHCSTTMSAVLLLYCSCFTHMQRNGVNLYMFAYSFWILMSREVDQWHRASTWRTAKAKACYLSAWRYLLMNYSVNTLLHLLPSWQMHHFTCGTCGTQTHCGTFTFSLRSFTQQQMD